MSAVIEQVAAAAVARPGESVDRLAALSEAAVTRVRLALRGRHVLTEAATGPYAVTPVLAALAGAEVVAITKDTRFGTVEEVVEQTRAIARRLGVDDRIRIVTERDPAHFAWADLITNSGHLRPITGEQAEAIRPGAALSLMFESWEIQAGRLDVDLEALVAKGVIVAGTNERHPHVGVFSYLGIMAVTQLADAGVPAWNNRISVLCDNPFDSYLVEGLRRAGADVAIAADYAELAGVPCDALLIALTPTGSPVISPDELAKHAARNPVAPVVQYWGDLDREACARAGVTVWPPRSPGQGHMGVLPSRPGPDAIVRLQCGGLKVGQVLLTAPQLRTQEELEYVDAYRGNHLRHRSHRPEADA